MLTTKVKLMVHPKQKSQQYLITLHPNLYDYQMHMHNHVSSDETHIYA